MFVDLSRNGSKRYCTRNCAHRAVSRLPEPARPGLSTGGGSDPGSGRGEQGRACGATAEPPPSRSRTRRESGSVVIGHQEKRSPAPCPKCAPSPKACGSPKAPSPSPTAPCWSWRSAAARCPGWTRTARSRSSRTAAVDPTARPSAPTARCTWVQQRRVSAGTDRTG
ncbi:CGNR zinc finger domain-containing protein [Saccharopolyspora gregorii]|uniref:CGNR zinc finger domain-containing protein n=1 Tax=Saccharopolyspora gregorii TaxID=33914 RepID=UPI0031E93D60